MKNKIVITIESAGKVTVESITPMTNERPKLPDWLNVDYKAPSQEVTLTIIRDI